jgi:hypothetical protein
MPHSLFQESRKLRTWRMTIQTLSLLCTKLTCLDPTCVGNPEQKHLPNFFFRKRKRKLWFTVLCPFMVFQQLHTPPPHQSYMYGKSQLRIFRYGERDKLIVSALRYKPEDCRFEFRWGYWLFSIDIILPAALGHGVYWASHINECQKQRNNVSEAGAAGA